MFRAFAFVMLLIPFFGTAQDYQMVRSDFIRFFADEDGDHHGIKIDSVETVGADSILYNYWHIRANYINSFSATLISHTPSFVGRKVVVRPNGVNLLFNRNDDTVRINTLSGLNESWNLMNLDSGSYIRATISEIQNQLILDSLVETKTITLQLLDSNENPLPHVVNGESILISKTLGIIACPDMYYFPNEIHRFSIDGMEKPNRGIFRPLCGEPYENTLGDEYHWWRNTWTPAGYYNRSMSISRIVDLINSFPLQTIVYHTTKLVETSEFPPSSNTVISSDTVVINLSEFPTPCTGPMPKESDELFIQISSFYNYGDLIFGIDSCNRPYSTMYLDENLRLYPDTAVGPNFFDGHVNAGEDYVRTTTTFGLGITKVDSYQWYPTISSTRNLVYYKRGIEECGTPYTEGELLAVNQMSDNILPVYPNPIRIGQPVRLPNSQNVKVLLFSVDGKQIPVELMNGTMKTDNLISGVYLLHIQTESGVSTQKLIVTD